MKVLCIVPSYWPAFQFGGPVTAVYCLNKVPIKKGVDLEVYTTNVGIEREVPVNNETSVDGTKTTYLSYIKYFEFLGDTGWQFSPRLIKALKNNSMKYDIVNIIGVWNFPSTFALYHCKKNNIPCIVSPHGSLGSDKITRKAWKKTILSSFYKKIFRRCDNTLLY